MRYTLAYSAYSFLKSFILYFHFHFRSMVSTTGGEKCLIRKRIAHIFIRIYLYAYAHMRVYAYKYTYLFR